MCTLAVCKLVSIVNGETVCATFDGMLCCDMCVRYKSHYCHCDDLDRPAACWDPMHGETAASSTTEGAFAEVRWLRLLSLLVVQADGLVLAYSLSKVRRSHSAFLLAPDSINCQADAHRFGWMIACICMASR